MKNRAFTLVEIMIVVLIIGLLLAIAVPNMLNARHRAQANSCIDNLRLIEEAKEQFAMESHLAAGAAVLETDLWPTYLKWNHFPYCPQSGTYDIAPVGETPTCSVNTGTYPHALNR